MNNFYSRFLGTIILIVSLSASIGVYAEGSKDLLPSDSDSKGNRVFLLSMTGNYVFNPFSTLGRMMVYAKAGETIYAGSSAQGIGNGTIKLYAPNGTLYTSGTNSITGVIANRTQELAGPYTASNTQGYTPYTRVVQSEEAGIWVIEFYAQGTTQSGSQDNNQQNSTSITWQANKDWSISTNNPITISNSAFITAWDVTVGSSANKETFIPGRVYTTVFNLGMNQGGQDPDGFFGKFYVLTRDGYSYLVDNNGQNGLSFNAFVSNKGALNSDGTPSYKSFEYSTIATLKAGFHDPREEDSDIHVTHKIFYNKPASDMPANAYIWMPTSGTNWPTVWNNTSGGTTNIWLHNTRGSMEAKNLKLEGVEGTDGYYTSKGAYFLFDSEVEGRYRITIPAVDASNTNRVLEGNLLLGENRVYWDGVDSNGKEFVAGDNLSNVSIQIFAAEIHFPFIDVENNVNGINIQALDINHNKYSPAQDLVWWNISGLSNKGINNPTNKDNSNPDTGYHSTISGSNQLKWGTYNGANNNFGDNRAIIEWINQTEYTNKDKLSISKLETDLEVESVTKNANTYIVPVRNNGTNNAEGVAVATFLFYIPTGLIIDPAKVTFQTANGITYNGNMAFTPVDSITDPDRAVSCLQVKLNMPAMSTGIFTIPFTLANSFNSEYINAWGTILRARDVYDPTAFYKTVGIKPTDPFQEANGIQKPLGSLNLNTNPVSNPDFTNLTITDTSSSNYTNNIKYSRTENVTPCIEENIFTEDFGISPPPNSSNNFGRSTSIYMPSGSFKFGTSYPNSTDYNEYAIDNNHYAVVAPGYIKLGHKQYDYYFWTPSFNESNTVQDRSATENGAVMVVNAGQTLNSFYQRQELLQVGASYRASFWLYLVNGPSQVAIDVKHPKTGEVLATITSPILWNWDNTVKNKWTYFDLYFSVPVPDDERNCTVDNIVLSFRNNYAENQGNDYYIDDIRLDKVCSVPAGTPILNCPDPNYKKNYWHGTVSNDWTNTDNWTSASVPVQGEDIEFATEVNNGTSGNGNGKGTAVRDLFLDTDRTIGSLINNSDVNMVVTTGKQLTINGTVKDENPDKGTIIVKSETNIPTGTLLFTDPATNTSVNATVEFINRAYECDNCGFYRKQWQYFGIPVKNANFPYQTPPVETVNQWIEPYNGNKWRLAPVLPDLTLKAFNGYEITNSTNVEPTQVYNFAGVLNVGDAIVPSTKTVNVNYSGMNLIGNSFTAAIPITSAAIKLESVQLNENTVYLYNMGSRDQWRKLNGGTTNGIAAGQYQSVPFNVAGQAGIPDRILSMHTFMLNVTTPGNITLKYDQLVKNELNSSTISPWKSAKVKSNTTQLSHIVMDVIGSGSADRIWLFENPDATTGFDNGWDGYKIKEGELIQAYISGSDQSDYQIATVPEITGTTIDVETESNESYSINLSVTPEVELRKLYLHDLLTGHSYPIVNNAEYLITGSGNSTGSRFKITSSSSSLIEDNNASSSINIYVRNNSIVVENQSEEDCMATIYDVTGRLVASKQIQKNEITEFSEISQIKTGIYIVKVVGKTNSIHKTLKVK